MLDDLAHDRNGDNATSVAGGLPKPYTTIAELSADTRALRSSTASSSVLPRHTAPRVHPPMTVRVTMEQVIEAASLFRAAALGDCDAGNLDDAVCPGCDGFIEFDDDGSNICTTCGGTWWTP